MSWKRSGTLVSGPPTLSGHRNGDAGSSAGPSSGSSARLVDRLRPNNGGMNVFQRERQVVARYGDAYADGGGGEKRTEWDVLKENHCFIRDDETAGDVSWEERLARAYESKLFKEFALIDLKHYKSKRLALRWRTAPEVVEGIGEDTCGSLRCRHHRPAASREDCSDDESDERDRSRDGRKRRRKERPPPSLRAFELPFAYEEAGERREALVKVRLCGRCEGKLRYKPRPEGVEGDSEEDVGRRDRRRDREKEDRRAQSRSRSPRRESRDRRRER